MEILVSMYFFIYFFNSEKLTNDNIMLMVILNLSEVQRVLDKCYYLVTMTRMFLDDIIYSTWTDQIDQK